MVKVVERKPKPPILKRVDCTNCGATLEYVPKDLQTGKHYDYTGSCDTYSFIKCPDCNAVVEVKGY